MTDALGLGLAVAAAASSLLLTGLIWVVHVVVYPAFTLVGAGQWRAYHRSHTRRITLVVGPPWAVQGVSALGLLVLRPPGVPLLLVLAHAALTVAPVAVTVAASVPAHRRLEGGPDQAAAHRLLTTNRLRVAAWTASAATGTWVLLALTAGG